ncbi:MAG: dienelactone hydrolase family protein [Fimbriimonadales bacterium]|nr:dienelactone hydrolase family protein [Fimbriimonadales bacterium]
MEAARCDPILRSEVVRAASKPLPRSPDEFRAFQAVGRSLVAECLGLDLAEPASAPRACFRGASSFGGDRIERWVLETQKGVWASLLLYVPRGRGPFPVVLNPHGHWPWKKQQPLVQQRAITQASEGFLAVVMDSPGASWDRDNPVERKELGTHWDFVPSCAGITATGVYVRDWMRAVDWLETVPAADCGRIGITGESGGGAAAVFAFAVDDRIRCAAPVVYAASLETQPDNGCPCNHLPGLSRLGDRAHALALRAPSPVLLVGATEDPEFPPDAVLLTHGKLADLGQSLGWDGWAEARIFEGPHTYSEGMQRAVLDFLAQNLQGRSRSCSGHSIQTPQTLNETDPRLICGLPEEAASTTFRSLAARRLGQGVGGRDESLRDNWTRVLSRLLERSEPPTVGPDSRTIVLSDDPIPGLPKGWLPLKAAGLWGSKGPSARYCTYLGVPTVVAAAAELRKATLRQGPRPLLAWGPFASLCVLVAAAAGTVLGPAVLVGLPRSHTELLADLSPEYDPPRLPVVPLASEGGDFPELLHALSAPTRVLRDAASLQEAREAFASLGVSA